MKLVRENLYEFHKTGDPLKAMGLGMVSIELDNYNLQVDENLNPIMNEDSEYFFQLCEDNNIHWEILSVEKTPAAPVLMRFTATKDDLVPLLVLFDPNGRDENQLRRELSNWNGSEDQLVEILF